MQRNRQRLRETAGEPEIEVEGAEQQCVGIQRHVEGKQPGQPEDQGTDVPAGRERRAAVALLHQDQAEGSDAEGAGVSQLPDQGVGFDDAGRPDADQKPQVSSNTPRPMSGAQPRHPAPLPWHRLGPRGTREGSRESPRRGRSPAGPTASPARGRARIEEGHGSRGGHGGGQRHREQHRRLAAGVPLHDEPNGQPGKGQGGRAVGPDAGNGVPTVVHVQP